MLHAFFEDRKKITDRLLAKREKAGDCLEKNKQFHRLVTRYQRFILRQYIFKNKNKK